MFTHIRALPGCRRGAVSVEYALLVALIVMVGIVVLNEISASNVQILTGVSDTIAGQNPS